VVLAFRHVGIFLAQFFFVASLVAASDRAAAELLPATTILYAEVPQPQDLIALVEDHPLRQRTEKLQAVKDAYKEKQFLQFKAAVSIVEAQLGDTWQNILKSVTVGGISIGFDPESEGVVLLVKARDKRAAPIILDTLIDLARTAAKEAGNSDPIKSGEYRGITAYQIDQAKIATFGQWLAVTNKPKSGQAVLDAYLDKPKETLASSEQFREARSKRPPDPTVWGYVNIEAIRSGGVAKDLFTGKTDNPVVEFLIGGMLDTLQHTPYVTASLHLTHEHTKLELATPHQQAWATDARDYFFGPDGSGLAPAPLKISHQLLSFSTYRDVSTMWLRASELFEDNIVDQFAQAESNLSTLFSGKDFGEEILGELGPEIQLVVARQSYAADEPKPAIKLPSFAAIFRMKDPETITPEFRRIFQSLIGFLNIVGSMNGQPQLDLDIDKEDGFQVVSANYIIEKDAGPTGLKIHYNFSPSVAFAGENFIVSSTAGLARELAEEVGKKARGSSEFNSFLNVDVGGVSEILDDNRAQLVAQNMLSEGNTKAEAELEIGDLLSLLDAIKDVSLDLKIKEGVLRTTLEITYTEH